MPEPATAIPSITNGSSNAVSERRHTLTQTCATIHAKIDRFLNEDPASDRLKHVQEQSRISLRVIGEALSRYSYDQLSLSYNGGKDCLVLLILYLSALHTHTSHQTNSTSTTKTNTPCTPLPERLQSVYIVSEHPFQQVDEFVEETAEQYSLDLIHYSKAMKEAFTEYLEQHSSVKAILVGTRRTDPHGATLSHFDPTDKGWPAFTRVHPVIDWHYADIWAFIRHLNIPYCSLYDLGYTSLGGQKDTYPNPLLRRTVVPTEGEGQYRPAYELTADDEERLGRQ